MTQVSSFNVLVEQGKIESTILTTYRGEVGMKKKIYTSLVAVFLTVPFLFGPAQGQEAKIPVLNPMGQPPAIARVPMAPRLTGLEGKTIYIVDVGFTDTHQFLEELQKLLSDRYPKTTWIVRTKAGNYFEDDPKLWTEIKGKGHGMIMGVGH
jgi:hypothetical protein